MSNKWNPLKTIDFYLVKDIKRKSWRAFKVVSLLCETLGFYILVCMSMCIRIVPYGINENKERMELYTRKRFAKKLGEILEPVLTDYIKYMEKDEALNMKSLFGRKELVEEVREFIREGAA